MKAVSFLRKFLPLLVRKWLDNSNNWIALFVTTRLGPLAVTRVEEVIEDPTTPTVCFCPHCAKAIKVNKKTGQVGVFLYHDDRTREHPDVMIQTKHTLFVSCLSGYYQVGCADVSCCKGNLRDGDLFGIIDATGSLVKVTSPLGFQALSAL